MSLEDVIIDYKKYQTDIEHWVTLKGEYRYKSIISFLRDKNIELSWANITRYVKYDKRLLINSFKYIVFLEEMYKSFVVKAVGRGNTKILSSSFENAYYEFLSLGEKANYDDVDLAIMASEKGAFNSFRNKVVHNKILLGTTFNGNSLEKMFNIFVKILPQSYRKGFVNDINNCSKGLTEDKWHIKLLLED